MSDYVPMTVPFPGEKFEGTSGSDADALFVLCQDCARDKEMNGTRYREGREAGDDDYCQVLAAALRNEAVEIRELEDGSLKCMAFVPLDQPITPARCEHTVDMFEQGDHA